MNSPWLLTIVSFWIILGNNKIYLYFLSHFNDDMAQVVVILPFGSIGLSCLVNIVVTDDLVIQGVRALAAMMTYLSQNILVSTTQELRCAVCVNKFMIFFQLCLSIVDYLFQTICNDSYSEQYDIDGFVQDSSNSSALAMELL